MAHLARTSLTHTVDATPKQAYDIAGPVDPTRFYPRLGPLPAVTAVRNQTGTWDTPGRSRTLVLSDGGSVVETITDAHSPSFFAYDLSHFRKLFGALVSGARAEWRFDRAATGTTITWTYTFFGKPGRGLIVSAIVRLFWGPYMRRVLPRIAAEVAAQVAA
jgi:hypothetical protein